MFPSVTGLTFRRSGPRETGDVSLSVLAPIWTREQGDVDPSATNDLSAPLYLCSRLRRMSCNPIADNLWHLHFPT
jgi:hypothetical protein